MTYILIVLLVALLLFGLAYTAKRRFGVLVLALIAGSMLATMWTKDVTPFVATFGFVIVKPPLSSVVAVVMTLLPAVLLLMGGPVVYAKSERIYGSIIFALVGILLVFKWLNDALVIDSTGKILHDSIITYSPLLLTAGIIAAIIDVFVTHTARRGHESKHK